MRYTGDKWGAEAEDWDKGDKEAITALPFVLRTQGAVLASSMSSPKHPNLGLPHLKILELPKILEEEGPGT